MLREECKGIHKDIIQNLMIRARSGLKNILSQEN